MMETRQARGLEIIATSEVIRDGNIWIVPSQHTAKRYTVNLFIQTCTCPDFDKNGLKCKHIYAAEYESHRQNGVEIPEPVKVERRTYRQEWHEYNLAQTNEKTRLVELLSVLCKGVAQPSQMMGRPRLPFAEMVFCAAYKVYSMFSSRRFASDVRDAQAKGYITQAPHFNSVSNYMKMESLTPCLKRLIVESSLPLKAIETDFAVDSSGFSTSTRRSWNETKWGTVKLNYGATQVDRLKKQEWLKVHVMTGMTTNVVTAVEVTESNEGDSPYFKPLLLTTSENFVLNSVVGDKAYSAEKNLHLVVSKHAQPYIPFKSNSSLTNPEGSALWKQLYREFLYNQEWFMQHYHKRSNVETTFSMVKAKFGERLRSKGRTAQVNEALCKILCHNICCLVGAIYELGIEPRFWAAS
jgi:transposase